jgi:hypothetical protein
MKWLRRSDEELKDHYRSVFGSKSQAGGDAVFRDLYDRCGVAKTNFVPGQPDMSAFNDGCRSIFLYILQMAYEPEQVIEKLKDIEATEYIDE